MDHNKNVTANFVPIPAQVAAPTFSPGQGTYSSAQTVYITTSTQGASIRYTTDGSPPTSPNAYDSLSPVAVLVSANTTIRAYAYKTGMTPSAVVPATYTITVGAVAAPTFDPPPDTYDSPRTVLIATSTTGARIRYTTDGSPPTSPNAYDSASPVGVAVSNSTTIRAYAYKGGMTASDVIPASYTITTGTVAAPTFSPGKGSYAVSKTVYITSTTAGATIRYTTAGSPTCDSGLIYSSSQPVPVPVSTTIHAKACKSGMTESGVIDAEYTITPGVVGAPSFSLPAGPYASSQTVYLTSSTTDAIIRYTTDGTNPDANTGAIYNSSTGIQVPSSMTVKAIAYVPDVASSSLTTAEYVIGGNTGTRREYIRLGGRVIAIETTQ
jgi:hypothetical protein